MFLCVKKSYESELGSITKALTLEILVVFRRLLCNLLFYNDVNMLCTIGEHPARYNDALLEASIACHFQHGEINS